MHPDRVENSTPPNNRASNPKDIAGQFKCPLHLLPGVAEVQIAWALAHGAEKYGGWNWRTSPIQATAYIAAARRHLAAWTDGEDCDSESGRSHLAHVAATMAILLDAMACGMLCDDRPKNGMVAKLLTTSADTAKGTRSVTSASL